jgi:hypothetical protein
VSHRHDGARANHYDRRDSAAIIVHLHHTNHPAYYLAVNVVALDDPVIDITHNTDDRGVFHIFLHTRPKPDATGNDARAAVVAGRRVPPEHDDA